MAIPERVAEKTRDAKTLPRVAMPNREGFIPDPRPELFKQSVRGLPGFPFLAERARWYYNPRLYNL